MPTDDDVRRRVVLWRAVVRHPGRAVDGAAVVTWAAVLAVLRRLWSALRAVPWQVWVFAAAIAAAFVYGDHRGAASRQPEVDAARQTAATCVALNATNQQTIGTLRNANAEWASKNAADKVAADKAVAAVARERDALQAEVDKRRAQRDELYAHDETAAAWGRARVPDSVARGLRK